MSVDAPVPYDIAAEEAVLGSILLERDTIVKIATMLKPDDFYREIHRAIYEAMLDLYKVQVPPDPVALNDALASSEVYKRAGGSAYLVGLVNRTPTATHAHYYASIVERTASLRRLIETGGAIAALGYQEAEPGAAIEKAAHMLSAVGGLRRSDYTPIEAVAREVYEGIQERSDGGVPTGYDSLDALLGGLQEPDLIIMAARPGIGKTSLAMGLTQGAAERGYRVGVFSLEMSRHQLVQRLVSVDTGIDTQRIRLGWLSDEERARAEGALRHIESLPILIDDTPALRVTECLYKATQMQADGGLDLVVVDYLQLMQGQERRTPDRRLEVDDISRTLKKLARTLRVPVVALSQLSRDIEKRSSHEPELADLRESGGLEQDADTVVFIHREEIYNPDTDKRDVAELLVRKNRSGPLGRVPLHFDPSTTRFTDLHYEARYY